MPKRSHSDGEEDDKKVAQVDTKDEKKPKKPRTSSTAERTGAWSEAEIHELLICVLANASFSTGQTMYDQVGARLGRSPKSVKNMWLMRLKKEVEDVKASLG